MRNKLFLLVLIILILVSFSQNTLATNTSKVKSSKVSEKPEHLGSVYENTGTNDLIVDAFVIGKFKDIRYGGFGTIYIYAVLVYTTQFHRFYTGELDITGFRGILKSSFICGFYNDGW